MEWLLETLVNFLSLAIIVMLDNKPTDCQCCSRNASIIYKQTFKVSSQYDNIRFCDFILKEEFEILLAKEHCEHSDSCHLGSASYQHCTCYF